MPGYSFLPLFAWASPLKPPVSPLRRVSREASVPGLGLVVADTCVDLTGQTCLRTNLVAKRVLDAAPSGTVIEIVSDNLSAVETLPFMFPGHDCTHLATVRDAGGWRILARKESFTGGGLT